MNNRGRGRQGGFGRFLGHDTRFQGHVDQGRAQGYEDRGRWKDSDRTLNTIKVNLLTFQGGSNLEEFLEWKLQSERIFLTNNVFEASNTKYALTQFEGYASTWWESKKLQRAQQNIYDLPTWNDLIELMEIRWLPSTYRQDALKRVYLLKQGSKSVEEYFDEFEDLRMKAKLEEQEECTIIRFVAYLNCDIAKPMRLKTYNSLEEAFHDVSKVEADLKEERSYKDKESHFQLGAKAKISGKLPLGKSPRPTLQHLKLSSTTKPRMMIRLKEVTILNPTITVQCFKCQGRGYYTSECPNRRTITIVRDGYRTEDEDEGGNGNNDKGEKSEYEGDFDEEVEIRYEEALNHAIVARKAMGALAREESDQRENLFHARCKIVDKVCSLIIDGGSCTNAVSQFLVESMKFPTRKHTNPYILQWFNECGEMRVNKQTIIKFSIGKYQDKILCDVVPMQACHLLLGRPWQFDVDAQHSGRANKYSFVVKRKKYILIPLNPYQVSDDYRVMRELRETYQKEDKEKNERETLLVISGEGTSQDSSKKCLLAKPSNCLKGVDERHFMVCLVNKDILLNANQATSTFPSSMSSLLQEYEALFLEEMPDGLPPLRGIEHQIDFVPGSQIPNKPAYRSNPEKTKELQRQVEELLKKGLVKESLSPCVVPAILVLKKDGTWRMYKITVKYQHPIPRLDDMLD
ncbi:uncharacterized protein LOC132064853 [Lycium ferocissimum]|uniref:uncharacterized protein LOC132064853 n=1 Tax=Lycium ferocissimum TaxID=112874 RepID=UPI0028162795|nr:uncharacterized protein LOC132064853 [Lycium ferocissimum]